MKTSAAALTASARPRQSLFRSSRVRWMMMRYLQLLRDADVLLLPYHVENTATAQAVCFVKR